MKRLVYDTFLFSTELDVLEIRLHELRDVVDFHVLIESTETFTGRPKPLHYRDNAARFAEFAPKILHVAVSDLPATGPWGREHFSRDCMGRVGPYPPRSLVLIGDVDEIPRAEAVAALGHCLRPVVFGMRNFQFWLNREVVGFPCAHCTRAVAVSGLDRLGSASRVRAAAGAVVPDAGWHLSWVGGVETVRGKLESFSHQELNVAAVKTDANLRRVVDTGGPLDPASPLQTARTVPPAEWPRHVRDNQWRFSHLIKES